MSSPLKLYFIPYLPPGHMIPLSEIARLFAIQGHQVTIITTPANAALLAKHTSPNLSLHLVDLPSKEAGLDNFKNINDLKTAAKRYHAVSLLRPKIEDFITSNPPDCLVADMFYPWAPDLAARVGIPGMVFHGKCTFAMCMKEAMRGDDAPHGLVKSDYEPFEVHGLPDRVMITRAQLPDYIRTPSGYTQLMEHWREAEKSSYGVLVNNFDECEPAYTAHYEKIMGHTVWNVGPSGPMLHRDVGDRIERVYKAVAGQQDYFDWLDTKMPNSVLYVCFGSSIRYPDEQLFEIACGLMSSGAQFIWALLGKEDEVSDLDTEKWLPKGFENMVKETGKGMIIRGWAPQVLILDHSAIGGFMTHCGWNSTLEGISAGVPMITWPLCADQFYNEKLITQVLKIGIEVGVEDWNMWLNVGKKLVERTKIEAAIKTIMNNGGEEVEVMRNRAKELREKARNAVKEGGSSDSNLMALIEELKRMRDNKTST